MGKRMTQNKIDCGEYPDDIVGQLIGVPDAEVIRNYHAYIIADIPEIDITKLIDHLSQKYRHKIRRLRKDADNKEHLRKLAQKRGAIVNA